MDGRSSFDCLLQLLEIIENVHHFSEFQTLVTDIKNKSTYVLPDKEEIYKNRRSLVADQYLSNCFLKTPDFLDHRNAYKSAYIRLKYLSSSEEEGGMIYNHDGMPFISVKKLTESSKLNNSKFRTLIISQPDLSALIKKCRENGTKLTSLLNIVMVLALQLIYKR